ncbi:MAG: hypothetical protein M0P01_02060 [Treponema sp.]|nr:hypothetical protein [Treponema sp.]
MINKKSLSEADIIAKYIRPAITDAGWQENQIRQEFSFTAGWVFVKGEKTVEQPQKKRTGMKSKSFNIGNKRIQP